MIARAASPPPPPPLLLLALLPLLAALAAQAVAAAGANGSTESSGPASAVCYMPPSTLHGSFLSCMLPAVEAATCDVTCDNGYVSIESAATCLNGLWSGVPQCLSACTKRPETRHGWFPDCSVPVIKDGTCVVQCNDGYIPGHEEASCTSGLNGMDVSGWTDVPECFPDPEAACKTLPFIVNGSFPSCSVPAQHSSKCTVRCFNGYKTDHLQATCTGGVWKDVPECSVATMYFQDNSGARISLGAVAALVVVATLLAVSLGACFYFYYFKRRNQNVSDTNDLADPNANVAPTELVEVDVPGTAQPEIKHVRGQSGGAYGVAPNKQSDAITTTTTVTVNPDTERAPVQP